MSHTRPISNFGRNIRLHPTAYYEPRSERELLEILDTHHGESIRVVGRLHCWGEALNADGVVLDLRHLNEIRVEKDAQQVVLGAGIQIKAALKALKKHQLTLPSLGLISEQSIGGATATGTHGSGKPSLSHFIKSIRIAHYDPDTQRAIITDISDGPQLQAARCSLGCLGVVVSLTMEVRPQYNIEVSLEEVDSVERALQSEDTYPLQQFYFLPWRWTCLLHLRRESPATRSKLALLFRLYWFVTFDVGLHLVLIAAVRLLKSTRVIKLLFHRVLPMAVIQRWRVVDDSVAALVMEHELFRHIEIELFVPRSRLVKALDFVRALIEVGAGERSTLEEEDRSKLTEEGLLAEIESLRGNYRHHYPICIRKVLADQTLLSMASSDAEPWYAISLISYVAPADRDGFFAFANAAANSMRVLFGARPHWGKVCPINPAHVKELYPHSEEFISIRQRFDPDGRFSNAWIKEVLAPN